MMQYESNKLGTIEYKEQDVLHFEQGLFGFERLQKYVLVDGADKSYFKYLQSLEDPKITFVVCNPIDVMKDYELVVDKEDVADLNLENIKDIANLVIATIPQNYEEISVNLLGSLVINVKNRHSKQVVSQKKDYTTKYYLLSKESQNLNKKNKKII